MLFTDMITDYDLKWFFGSILIYLTIFNLALNIVIIFIFSAKDVVKSFKLLRLKIKNWCKKRTIAKKEALQKKIQFNKSQNGNDLNQTNTNILTNAEVSMTAGLDQTLNPYKTDIFEESDKGSYRDNHSKDFSRNQSELFIPSEESRDDEQHPDNSMSQSGISNSPFKGQWDQLPTRKHLQDNFFSNLMGDYEQKERSLSQIVKRFQINRRLSQNVNNSNTNNNNTQDMRTTQ
ncbi:UNKNOWN [Stylonychia lemnae]|uniref:Uncharacterized protein n=1 Tax=Stylonychia lemnae TaxID=5949 RepID=A0A078A6Q8_STYLE|nr:UNKNOWN [Stylonychia lemnae]|eukprot:CDW77940.1 UNKNOWN [Stylonychia lemnae]